MDLVRFFYDRSRAILLWAAAFGFLAGALNCGLLAVINAAMAADANFSSSLFFVYGALCLLAPCARLVSELLLVRLSQDSILHLRTRLGAQVLAVPLAGLEQVGPHRILSVLTDDIPSITNVAAVVPILCINSGVILSGLAYMAWLQWKVLAAVLAFMIFGSITYQLSVHRTTQHFLRSRQMENKLQNHFHALIHGIKELKLHAKRRQAFLGGFEHTASAAHDSNLNALQTYTLAANWGQFLVFLMLGIPVFVFSRSYAGSHKILAGFSLALLYLTSPLQVVMNAMPGLKRANVAIRNLQELGLTLTRSADAVELAAGKKALTRAARLDLVGAAYSYRREETTEDFTVGPVDLTVYSGELLFLAGGNGSGKTTLAKMIVGLYAPTEGYVLCDGEPVNAGNRDSYRQMFSAIFADFFVFDSLLGLEGDQLNERVRESLRSLRLEHKVQIEDGVFSTTALSQGQRKRLALLTACMEDRPILFFDEWAADQDPVFKEIFYLSILPSLKAQGKTVLVISHDDRYFNVADRVLYLESGRPVEQPALSAESR